MWTNGSHPIPSGVATPGSVLLGASIIIATIPGLLANLVVGEYG